MSGAALAQRCWNHEGREAVCRCPECGRSFCRECVTEHETRLLCAACLRVLVSARASRRGGMGRRMAPALLALAGLLLAWVLFFGAGETLIWFTGRVEQGAWQER